MVTDSQRRELYDALVRGLGEGPASTMMDLVPAGWSDVATRSDVVELGAALRGEMRGIDARLTGEIVGVRGEISQLRGEMSELRGDVRALDARLTGKIAGVRGEIAGVRGEIAGVRGEIEGVRGEIEGVRGEVAALSSRLDAQLAKLIMANLATSAAFAGMVFAAVRLAGL